MEVPRQRKLPIQFIQCVTFKEQDINGKIKKNILGSETELGRNVDYGIRKTEKNYC